MRVIAGRLKGRRLDAPGWPGLRPTSDKLRETLFNVLRNDVDGSRVLDGFAGTGAVGIEAISRGAAHVTFLEQDRRALQLLAGNLRHCGVAEGYTIERAAVVRWLARSSREFDIVFLDPPYAEPDLEAVVDAGFARLAPGGILVLEHASRRDAPGTQATAAGAPGPAPTRIVTSGDSALAFYRRHEPEPDR